MAAGRYEAQLRRESSMKSRILLIVPVILGAVLIAAQQNQNEMERNPLAGNPEASAAGDRRFQQTCASCHGDSARAPSLATGAFTRGGQDWEIFQNIRNGIPGTQMLPFSGLSTEQIWQLVTYVRSLTDSTPAAGGSWDPTSRRRGHGRPMRCARRF